jgi:8-oxo-dGTP pyrophosphatase MutT (NUDIX family)
MGLADPSGYRHSVSVAGIVIDDQGRVLLIRRVDNGEWEPPGGVVEDDEDLLTALVREVHEESGFTVRPGPLTGVYKNMALGLVALVFRCDVLGGVPTIGQETSEVRWTDTAELGRLVGDRQRLRIEDALTGRPAAVIRAYAPAATTF